MAKERRLRFPLPSMHTLHCYEYLSSTHYFNLTKKIFERRHWPVLSMHLSDPGKLKAATFRSSVDLIFVAMIKAKREMAEMACTVLLKATYRHGPPE